MAIKKSDIYRSLWDSCDQLRGGMDASLYKDYILTLLFVKYVSDRADQPDALVEVPPGCSFDDMRALRGSKNIGEEMDKIIAEIARVNGLSGVVDRAFFNDAEKFGRGDKMKNTLTALVNIFGREELNFAGNRADGDDILGDAYEYLMRNFAAEAGKSKGQFYTPSEVSRVVAVVAGLRRARSVRQTVYDPACGSASLLLKAANTSPQALSIYGQEMDITTRGLAVMNMILHNEPTAEIAQGDVLADPEFKDTGGKLKTHDFVVANPPFSSKAWATGFNPRADHYGRFDKELLPPEKNGDFAFLLHILASMKSTGSGAVILPHGVLFRGNAEAKLRARLLCAGVVKGIIGLPANLFYGTGIPAAIIVLDKSGARERRPVFMIDASKGFMKDGNKNRLRERDIHKITDVFEREAEIDGYARSVAFDEIEANAFNLNLPRYIDGFELEDRQDIEAHLKGGVPDRDLDALHAYWDVMPSLRSELFGPNERSGYSDPKVDAGDVRRTVRDHPEFAAFRDAVLTIFDEWRTANLEVMRGFGRGDRPAELIHALSEDLLERFRAAPLIDPYAAYQRIMSYWTDTMQDDAFVIGGAGWEAARDVRPARLEVKDGKRKWLEVADLTLKRDRFVCDVIPPALVINRYFSTEKAELNRLTVAAEMIGQEVEELVEEHAVEDGLLFEALSDTCKITVTSIKARLKDRAVDAEERAMLVQAEKLIAREKKAKDAVRAADEALTAMTLAKYADLPVLDIKEMVIEEKWVGAILDGVETEIELTTQSLTGRLRELTVRYAEPLPQIEARTEKLATKVASHLKVMGVAV